MVNIEPSIEDSIVTREINDPNDPILPAARALYESVLDEAERIPWEWLARTPERRRSWRPGQRRSHLVVAVQEFEPRTPIGFGYGAFLPGYGGYVCYLGVDPVARGHGLGTRLFEFLFELIADAARSSNLALPFIIWESRRPDDLDLWKARLRLFEKVGGLWARGIVMQTPNYMEPDAPPVPLHIFVRPWDKALEHFNADQIRDTIHGLYQNIYRIPPNDSLYEATMTNAVNPHLAPAVDALEER